MVKIDIAFIPPEGLQERMWEGKVGMALAHLMTGESTSAYKYRLAVASFGGWPSNYLLLDNGAAEDVLQTNTVLTELCKKFQPAELVAPDKLGDSDETIKRVEDHLLHCRVPGQKYMAVAQGTKLLELKECANHFNDFAPIKTIGIPRLVVTKEYKQIRLDFADYLLEKYGTRFKIHLLGTNPIWVKEVYYAAKYHPHIRSVDTSLPYNYTIAGERLDTTTREVGRPAGYYGRDWRGVIDEGLMKANEQVMKDWLLQAGK